ncbi:MAG: hypothetical protein V1808_03545 [Candidatus Daviesbacteria bacterium]
MAEKLSEQDLEDKKDVIKFLEFGIGRDRDIKSILELSEEVCRNSLLDEKCKNALSLSETVYFVDGMKFALGIIKASEIRSIAMSYLAGVEVLMAKIAHPEIFNPKIKTKKHD